MYSPLRFLPSVIYKRRPLHLTFFVTRRCNARCPFCFYLEKKGGRDEAPELSLEEIKGVASSMGELLWLALSGGEVYLRKDIVEIADAFYRHNKPSIILLPTNGLAPALIREKTVEILKRCSESIVAVKLSLDGPENLHDAMRGTAGGFDKVMETYEALGVLTREYRNFELGVNTVFCSENQDRMGDIIEFVKSLKMIKTHTISMVRGDIRDETYKDIDIGKYLDAIGRLEQGLKDGSSPTYSFSGARVKAAQDIIQRRLIHRTFKEKRRLLPCYAGHLNMVLTETGDIYPCESFREEHGMGNVREHGLDMGKALRSERAKKATSSIRKSCFCTHECYMMTNILFNPRQYPGLLKELLWISRA